MKTKYNQVFDISRKKSTGKNCLQFAVNKNFAKNKEIPGKNNLLLNAL